MDGLSLKNEETKKRLCFALISVFFWGLLAHGYGFLNGNFTHDSLAEFNGAFFGDDWKIQLGRIVVPYYRYIFRTELTLPWLIGLLSCFWIGLAVFCVLQIFRVESKLTAFLIAGIFTTNITVTATAATYMHDLDCDMFALFCAAAAVFLWKQVSWGWLAGSIFVALSLGIYQSYVFVAIVLVLMVCIFDLLNGEKAPSVFGKGMRAIGMLALGAVLYFILLKTVLAVTGITLASGDANNLDALNSLSVRSVIANTFWAYVNCAERLFQVVSPYSRTIVVAITAILGLIAALALIAGLVNRQMKCLEKLLCVVLIGLLPLGMNGIYVLTSGEIHDLMVYAVWLFYLLVLLLSDWLVMHKKDKAAEKAGRKHVAAISAVLTAVLLYGNVQTANVAYLQKDLAVDAQLSLMTRILGRVEAREDYDPGVTPIVFLGLAEQEQAGFEKYSSITGIDSPVCNVEAELYCRAYFRYILNNSANIQSEDVIWAMSNDERVAAMPNYPDEGCIAMVDDIMVVKLGDLFWWLN